MTFALLSCNHNTLSIGWLVFKTITFNFIAASPLRVDYVQKRRNKNNLKESFNHPVKLFTLLVFICVWVSVNSVLTFCFCLQLFFVIHSNSIFFCNPFSLFLGASEPLAPNSLLPPAFLRCLIETSLLLFLFLKTKDNSNFNRKII